MFQTEREKEVPSRPSIDISQYQKADGICKKGIFNIYPSEISQLELNLSHIEYEFIKSENICYLFNYIDKTIDIYDIIIKLRFIHPNISNKIYPPLSLKICSIVLRFGTPFAHCFFSLNCPSKR